MFPYRRGNQRKRSKGNPQRRAKGGGARRLPGSARELLPLLQPTTKALAQVLAGNAKPSGQFVHARNVVERAEQLVAEQQVERLGIREREEFLEQLARLKLTVSDAEAELGPEIVEATAEEGDEADEEAQPSEGYDVMIEDETDPEAAAERRAVAEAAALAEEAAREAAEAEARAEHQQRLRRVALALMQPSTEVEETHAAPPAPMSFDEAEGAVDLARGRPSKRRELAAQTAERAPAKAPRTNRPRLTMRGAERDVPAAKAADEGLASEG